MPRPCPPSRCHLLLGLLVMLLPLAGCGDDEVAGPSLFEPLVGDWTATELTLTNEADRSQVEDLIERGATFDLNIQSSGQYTAILVLGSLDQTEFGQVEVSGNQVTLHPNFPPDQPSTTGTFQLQGTGFTLDGRTEFDFNSDGTPEPAEAHFAFVPG